MPPGKLRKLHNETFHNTKWRLLLPGGTSRDIYEKRLYWFYVINNPHYPEKHPDRETLIRKGEQVLSSDLSGLDLEPEERIRGKLKQQHIFTKTNIKRMPISEVDRCLAVLGIWADVSEGNRKRMLWEWYHKPPSETGVRRIKAPKINNQLYLRDIIIENPSMTYDEFRAQYGEDMPTVTRSSYTATRCYLRKAGYRLPELKRGPKNPAVSYGKAVKNG